MTENTETPALAIAGELTIFAAHDLKAQLLQAIAGAPPGADVCIDLADVTDIDTAGLQLMLMAKREGTEAGRNVRFVGHSDAVLDLIDLCDLAGQFGDPVVIRSQARGSHESR